MAWLGMAWLGKAWLGKELLTTTNERKTMTDVTAERYPLDYDTLKKGDVIPLEKIEELTGLKYSHPSFGLKALYWRDKIRDACRDRGLWFTFRMHLGSILVLTDSEATKTNQQRNRAGRKKIANSHADNIHVDRSKLSDAERHAHDRRLEVDGHMLQAMQDVRRRYWIKAQERTTPGLPEPAAE